MSDTVELRKVIGGTKVLVNGRFVGWKCDKCNASCSYNNRHNDLCRYREAVKGVRYSLVTPLGAI